MVGHEALFSGSSVSSGAARLGTVRGSSSRSAARRRTVAGPLRPLLLRLAGLLAMVGLLTVSWDRLLNLQIASYNVKLPALVFTAAFVLALIGAGDRFGALIGSGPRRVVTALTAAIVLYDAVRAAFTPSPTAAAAQIAALLTGAVLPAATLLLVVQDREALRRALRWLLGGAAVASAFGLYQLLAFYLGWPQGIPYTGVGIGSGLGRISAFNYEPAYFAYYLVLALGAYVALRRLEGADVRWRALIAFAVVLYLANVRAVPLVGIAFAVLLLPALSSNRRLLVRGAVVAAATAAVALAVPVVIASVTAAQQQVSVQAGEASQDGDDDPSAVPSASVTPTATATATAEAPSRALQSQLRTTVDPDEPSSNGPRLDLYRAVLAQVQRSPVFGLGPGQLAAALRGEAPETVQDQGAGQVVANNIWLQALADGGIPLLLLELALVIAVAVAAVQRRTSAVYPMAAAWLAVVAVGGMLTSYLFDIKIWVVLALLLVGLTTVRTGGSRLHEEEVR